MQPKEINDLNIDSLRPFVQVSDKNLHNDENHGRIVVESPNVIQRALEAGLQPQIMLCNRKNYDKLAKGMSGMFPNLEVFVADDVALASITGYSLTRGMLCTFDRPAQPPMEELIRQSTRIGVLVDICDTTNVGAIFRSAAALGVDCLLVSPQCCDPFHRRCIRVSMGAVFQIPWAKAPCYIPMLKENGFETLSFALSKESVFLQDFDFRDSSRYAVLLGSEGYGLPIDIIAETNHTVKIPMYNEVDSLNVAATASIAFWELTKSRKGKKEGISRRKN